MLEIRENYKNNWKPKSDPYSFVKHEWMTPIEKNVWAEIRFFGLPMYPQFPIGKYFADFADPENGVIIEADGKFHDMQKDKDFERQKELEKYGWRIYRIRGSQTFHKDRDDYENSEVTDLIKQIIQEEYTPSIFY